MDIIDYPDLPQRARIVKIAAQLFARRGYHAVGMSDIQDAVQLGRGALYHHIRSKEDLLYDVTREYITELADNALRLKAEQTDPLARLSQLGSVLVHKVASHQAELTVCFRDVQSLSAERCSEVMSMHGRYEQVWRDTLIEGAQQGVFRPYDAIVLKAVLGMYYYCYLWMKPGRPDGAQAIAERFNELTLRMVRAG
jgi:AcrR family transcriptional regulator